MVAQGDEPVAALEGAEGARLRPFVFRVAVFELGGVVSEGGG